MAALPNAYNISTASGGQWAATFALQNDDGTLMNITNKVFEFVVRTEVATVGTVVFSVTSTTANTYGYMVVNTTTSTVQAVISPTATALVSPKGLPFTLWMNQGLSDATALVAGVFFSNLVAQP